MIPPHRDQGAQGDQKKTRDALKREGIPPAKASRQAKKEHPLPDSQAKSKNRQPRGGKEPGE